MKGQSNPRVGPVMIAFRRRSAVERRVLMFLRGGDESMSAAVGAREEKDAAPRSLQIYFAELRRAADAFGLAVQSSGTPYVSDDERLVLGWIAQAQRVLNYTVAMPDDPALVAAIARCAGMLDAMGLRLSPLTLYGGRPRGVSPTIRRR